MRILCPSQTVVAATHDTICILVQQKSDKPCLPLSSNQTKQECIGLKPVTHIVCFLVDQKSENHVYARPVFTFQSCFVFVTSIKPETDSASIPKTQFTIWIFS